MGLLDALQDPTFRADVGKNAKNLLQSTSNTLAENVSMPVDAMAWILRKAGVPIPENPTMGSDWMRQNGLTAAVQPGPSAMAGETLGLLAPMSATKQGAAAVAKGLLSLEEKSLPVGLSMKSADEGGILGALSKKFSYPQDQALATAQKNAAKPISEGGLGLRPDNTPMERAQAMGFDENLYHGTPKQIQFERLNPSDAGSIYATKKQDYANDFSKRKMVIDPMTADDYVGQVFPLKGNLGNSTKLSVNQMEDAGYSPNFVSQMKKSGFDSGISKDGQVIFTNPSILRSRFAAFDPARRNEADLLAGLLPLSVMVDQEQKNKLKGLLSR
jgi:hypothetical protein